MVSLRFSNPLVSKHIKNLFRRLGFLKWLFKCSKVNKLGNFGFSILRFLAQNPHLPIQLSIYLSIYLSNSCFRRGTRKFDSIMKPRFRQKFQLIGKDAEVWFYNKTTFQEKFQLIGKDAEVWFYNETTVQNGVYAPLQKFQPSRLL